MRRRNDGAPSGTTGTGRRAVSLTRSSSPTSTQLATSDEPPCGQERRRQPGERDEPGHPADDDEDLQAHRERQAEGEQPTEGVAHRSEALRPRATRIAYSTRIAISPVMPSSSPSAGDDEVGVGVGDEVGVALRDAGAEDAAVRQAVQRLHDLVARAVGVGEGVQPDLDALVDVAEHRGTPRTSRRGTARRR